EIKVSEGEEFVDEEPDETSLPPWLLRIGLLHPQQGLKYCGGVNEYMEALYIFAASIDERAEEIERAYSIEDWDTYTVKIHALKTMTRSVGADELSDLARGLEEAGSQLDTAAIRAGHVVFTSLYKGLKEYLSPLLKEVGEQKQAKERLAQEQRKAEEAGTLELWSSAGKPRERGRRMSSIKKKILLVDDDKDYQMLLSRWLGRRYKVETADSGAGALRHLKTEHPDLILLDFYMPGMDGPETLRWIRENSESADIPVVFLSGTEDRENVSRAEKLNPQGFLPKTLGKAALLKGIAGFLDKR
ncbi:MAG: response regulator, partial [Lachnospiraceae bacterium]|nr:response regulator [Lachnospiraceae bacterium]